MIDPKMVRRLNFNLEERAMPAGKQCVGTSRHTQLQVPENEIQYLHP
jgi:hypothetical protein